ncbi:MAG: zinc-finger domain-containing protein [Bacteroidia bacterium]|nr:MAG: zinc-finger domain-containing protein [Bacteroidia bacterium]
MSKQNKERYIIISKEDLPLCCPMPKMVGWNSHPRVFLPIEKEPEKKIICPYCSTIYELNYKNTNNV